MADPKDSTHIGKETERSESIRELTGRAVAGGIHSFEDRDQLQRDWKAIDGSACVYDCYGSYSLYEWLNDQGVIKIERAAPGHRLDDVLSSTDHRFAGFRFFARRFDPAPFVNNLILFDNIYVNLYGFYADNSDLGRLSSYGLFRQYPNPTGQELLNIYRLEKPQVLSGMVAMLKSIPDLPSYDQLFKKPDAAAYFGGYSSLMSWLYDEESKARCGAISQEGALFELFQDRYYTLASVLLDFVETALIFRGSQVAGSAPMAATMAGALRPVKPAADRVGHGDSRDVLGLFQVASDSVLGMSVAINSFDDVLRLRDDKRLGKIRDLLTRYVVTVESSDEQVVMEITAAMSAAKQSLKQLKWRESPRYVFVVKPLTYVPFVGQVVSLVDDALDVIQYLKERKHGWIYFGSQ